MHLIGKESEDGYLAKLKKFTKRYELEDKVFYHGFCDPFEYYRTCDIFVLSSTAEGFPMVVLEAMSVGMPAIATKAGGTVEQISDGKNGFLIDQGDTDSFAGKLVFFIENRHKIEEMGINGYHIFKKHFTIDHMIDNYRRYFESLP